MDLPFFVQPGAEIVIENNPSPIKNGLWAIEKVTTEAENSAARLSLKSLARANQAFLNINFDPQTMRPVNPKNDVGYRDAFLPVSSEITVKGSSSSRNGVWVVESILSGDCLDNARLSLRGISRNFNCIAYMTTSFDPETMTVTRKADHPIQMYQKKR